MSYSAPLLFPNIDTVTIASVRKRARIYATAVVISVAVGLIYMALSIGLMYHLFQSNNQSCAARQDAREAIRATFAQDPDWTDARQARLDVVYRAKVDC